MINPGIRRVVELLTDYGFKTTDSGDGETNREMEQFRPYGHVVVVSRTDRMVEEARGIVQILSDHGVTIGTLSSDMNQPFASVQVTWDAVDEVALIDITHIYDRMLA